MIKKIILFIIIVALCFINLSHKAYADSYYARITNSNTTTWEVGMIYYQSGVQFPEQYFYVSKGTTDVGINLATGTGSPDGNYIQWRTTCVDPKYLVNGSTATDVAQGNWYYWYIPMNVTCGSWLTQTCAHNSNYLDSDYAACYNFADKSQTLDLNDQCPPASPYCAVGGTVYGGTATGIPSDCAMPCYTNTTCNGCHTASQHYCSGYSCATHTVTDNSCTSGCGGAVVNGACNPTHYNCASGSSSGGRSNSSLTPPSWEWNCLGSGGGGNAYCTEPLSSPCSVTWDTSSLPSTLVAGQSYNIPITTNNASDGWQNISVYTDSSTNRGDVALTATGANTYNLNFNALTTGNHTLKFYNHDNVGYAGGAGPSGTLCTPTQPFTTSTPANGVCGTTHYDCTSGSLPWAGSQYSENWQWWCYGSNGGSNSPLCVEPRTGSCSVGWAGIPSLPYNTNYTVPISLGSASDSWYDVSVYKDGSASREGGLTSATSLTFNSGAAGSHNLTYVNNDYAGYGNSSGTGPRTSCTPTQSFCTAPQIPVIYIPATVSPGITNIVWDNTGTSYGLRIDDQTTPWANNCSVTQYGGDVCIDGYGSNSYPYNFQAGHTYSIWIHAISSCGAWSVQNTAPVSVPYTATAHVYVDFNGNGIQNVVGDPGYTGTIDEPNYATPNYTPNNDITYGGATGSNQTVTTGTNGGGPGDYLISNIPAGGTETISINKPANWKLTTAQTRTVTSSVVVNFGTQPPAPTCTMTANPITANPGGNSTLSVTGTKPPGYNGTLTYKWFTDLGSVSPATTTDPTTTTIWTAPNPYWESGTKAIPSVQTCLTGGSQEVCGNCQVDVNHQILIVPLHSISGSVYVDKNKDTIKDNGENNYTIPPYPSAPPSNQLTVSICPDGSANQGKSTQLCTNSGGTAINVGTNGTFATGVALSPGSYMVKLTPLPDASWSYSGNSSFAITVGKPCGSEPTGVSCDGPTGNVSNVTFGINNSNTWIQTTGGDIYQAGGISNLEPTSSTVPTECGGPAGHMSIQSPTIQMPGIAFTGNGSAYFGEGDANFKNWIVGKDPYKNTISLPQTTAYGPFKNSLQNAGITPKTASPSCSDINNCLLPAAPGVYEIDGNTVKVIGIVTAGNHTFPNTGDHTFLIPGNLDIASNIIVPIGATATFIVQGNITVDGSVGQDPNSSTGYKTFTSNIEGYYSTDQNFIVYGADPTKISSCPTRDRRLNMSGAVVVNANGSGGSLQIKRDMCDYDVCPAFSITARPDFVLYAPSYLQSSTRIWKEIAP